MSVPQSAVGRQRYMKETVYFTEKILNQNSTYYTDHDI